MIKQIYVCECDICGAIENAKAVTQRNETEYEIPYNWTRGNNKKVCICPACAKKLSAPVGYPVTAGDPIPVYGCPAVVLDNLHDALLSESSQGISAESTNECAPTITLRTDGNTVDSGLHNVSFNPVDKLEN